MRINLNIPRSEITCLLVAVSKHAHEFGVAAQRERSAHRLAGKPFSPETKDVIETWERHAQTLNNVKIEIKRQSGVK